MMPVNFKGKSFLTLMDFTGDEIEYLLDMSADLKSKKRMGAQGDLLKGKNIVVLFEKPSTRTRCAFEVAAYDEGANVTYLDAAGSQMNKKESLEDTAKVLGRYYDGIEYRGYGQEIVEQLAMHSGVPVWNGLTDTDHPTQLLADLLTIREKIDKPLKKTKVVFVGDTRNNMVYSWMFACAKLGFHFIGLGPDALRPDKAVYEKVLAEAKKSGAVIEFESDIAKVSGADVIYTDVWVSMGEEAQMAERVALLTPYRVTEELFSKIANDESIFMHCLPSFHDFNTTVAKNAKEELGLDIREVTDDVFKSAKSVVFDEAENRMHTIKAVMVATMA